MITSISESERFEQIKYLLSTPHAKVEYSKYTYYNYIQLKFILNIDSQSDFDGIKNAIEIGQFNIGEFQTKYEMDRFKKSVPLLNLCVAACYKSSSEKRKQQLIDCFITISKMNIEYPLNNLPDEIAALFVLN